MVLLVSNTAYNLYHYRRAVWQALLQQGNSVAALAAPDAYVEELRAAGIVFHPLPVLGDYRATPTKALTLYRQLRRVYAELRPAVILHFTIQANTVGSLVASHLRLPSVATITGLGTTWLRTPRSRWLVSLLYRWTLPRASAVVIQNQADQAALTAAGVRGARWQHIAGSGVDVDYYRPRTDTVLPPSRRFLYVGRMLIDKGIEELFTAWELACRDSLVGELHLVGERPPVHPRVIPSGIWEWGLRLPRVTMHPAQEDIRPHLLQSHFVVLPSYREGLSLTLLEALATRTPIITTLVPGCRELIEQVRTGWGVPPHDPRALADALLDASRTEATTWQRMGQNGRQLIERAYSAPVVAEQYVHLVRQLMVR